jgi:hypothetical protein
MYGKESTISFDGTTVVTQSATLDSHIAVASGATLTATGYTFTANHNLTGNGTMTGTTTLSGSGVQTLAGSSIGNVTLAGGGIKNMATAATLGSVSVTATTTVTSANGVMDINGTLYTTANKTLTPPATTTIAGNLSHAGIISPVTSFTATSTPAGTWSKVVYGGGKYVAVNSSNSGFDAMYSTDGINWTGVNASVGGDTWTDVTYGNGRFVAVGQDTFYGAMYSTDGITWTGGVTVASPGDNAATAVAYDETNSRFVLVGSCTVYCTWYSSDGASWSPGGSLSGSAPGDIVYGSGRLVLVYSAGVYESAYSTNGGGSWTEQASGPAGQWEGVTYDPDAGYFVAVEDLNDTMYSTDGYTWTSPGGPVSGAWQDVTYQQGVYLAVANSGTNRVMYSTNRTTWRPLSAPTTAAWTGVTQNGSDLFVAVSPTHTMYGKESTISFDGTTVQTLSGTLTDKFPYNVTFTGVGTKTLGGNLSLVNLSIEHDAPVSLGAYSMTVTGDYAGNGIVTGTTTLSGAGTQNISGASAGNVKFIGGGTKNLATSTTFGSVLVASTTTITSADNTFDVNGSLIINSGVTLTTPATTTITGNLANSGIFNNTSPVWTAATALSGTWGDIVYGGGKYVAVNSAASGFDAMYSTDGINWTGVNASNGASWQDVTYNETLGTFVAVGNHATYDAMYSTDGIIWTAVTSTGSAWVAVIYDATNLKYVAIGTDATYETMTSPDGITWTADSTGPTNGAGWTDITYGNGRVVAVANGGTTESAYSTDANNWSNQAAGPAGTWQGVTYGNGYYIAVEDGTDMMYSTDGNSWTESVSITTGGWEDVAYGGGTFLAVGDTGTYRMAYSIDNGLTWRENSSSGSIGAWKDVTYNGSRFVAISNASTTYSNVSRVVLDGADVQNLSGTLTGTSSFQNLSITNRSQNGSTSQSVRFGTAIKVVNTFSMAPATSASFLAGATTTVGSFDIKGASGNQIFLRSSSGGSKWYLASPTTAAIVQYVDVKDSRASAVVYANNSTNSGNNTNWTFTTLTGSTTLAAHTAGQVTNNFDTLGRTNGTLFTFKLTPNSGASTVTNIVLALSGAKKVSQSTFSNLRLYRDNNGNGLYEATEAQVGGTGVMSLTGQTGTLTFADDFTSTTTKNYIVIGTWGALQNGSYLRFDLATSGISISDATSIHTIFGSVIGVQHGRNNKGGGSASELQIGGPAPSGAGDHGGGGNSAGEQIGNDPNFLRPSAHSGSWTNGANAYDAIDGTYATDAVGITHSFTNHSFVVPGGNTVLGIEVKLEVSGTIAAGTIGVELSWNGGSTWTSAKTTPTLTTSDVVVTLGGPADTWGHAWTVGELSNANFAVRLTGIPSANTVRVDELQVRAYYQVGGGGSGGGADI